MLLSPKHLSCSRSKQNWGLADSVQSWIYIGLYNQLLWFRVQGGCLAGSWDLMEFSSPPLTLKHLDNYTTVELFPFI